MSQSVITGEAVAIELRPAGIASRGLALAIDTAVQGAMFVGLGLLAAAAALHFNDASAAAVVLLIYVAIVLGYPVALETLWHGRTLGKAALGLRVVRDDGGPIRFRHAFVRGLVGVVLDRPGISLGLLALIPMLTTRTGKRLGDLAAGTIVLQERVPSPLPPPAPMPPELAAWAATLDLSGVGDDLALRVRAFLARAAQLTDRARADMAQQLIGEMVSRTAAAVPPGMPEWAYLSAVLAERRRRAHGRQGSSTSVADQPPAPAATPDGPFAPPA